ncbi:unnamed protein product [Arabidopsis lyrata]|uniref:Predicted protein n=1 Tax=Arabidopsis lyrata subsp. lyrata TaxID=81972 RepID=D7M1P0_ARALL|nr:putative defensin-like protein 271 [Arabidopsis lyrata subsp. lyrata]XP_002874116.1 putative defensin-like protein 271 [Arabidopsis lyrata subsp. lyrata]CAH8271957.1 unnamed protein product [Arabidopsis lyrata]EFH50374.1 hypothetical protein ARALYDRAFT_910330 [Arabidopsis lyrata subsp. lyrata]EFH50375.1 predicted protein [Arabidopsis lyrata subsp. lyrata]CAH8271959.1 unnamed protein product [Arabidopsis lyrata]|eukprot:XP_002874115.1 putative defensin-like protein 271 [Arabidopsis lyrata subsp. lyrata]
MTSMKLHILALFVIVSFLVSAQSTRIMDASSDCEFKGPCHKKEDCYDSCGVNKPPFNNALCVPGRDSFQCCCILS